ncbi:MAG: hypothetical protein AAF501_07470 [Pseudomonadota bacterium]
MGLGTGLGTGLASGLISGLTLAAPAARAQGSQDGRALAQALAAAGPGDVVEVTGTQVLDAPLRVRSGIRLTGAPGARLIAGRAMETLVRIMPGSSGAGIEGLVLDGAGLTGSLINATGASDCSITACRGVRWRGGIVAGALGETAARGVRIARVTLETPAPGAVVPMLVRSGIGGPLVRDVVLEDIRVTGVGGSYSRTNSATADQVVLQGVRGFRLSRIESTRGGENGITVGRLSGEGLIEDCLVAACDGHGLNVGSGYVAVTVEGGAGLAEGMVLRGPGRLRAGLQRRRGQILFLNRIVRGRLAPGDILRAAEDADADTGLSTSPDSLTQDSAVRDSLARDSLARDSLATVTAVERSGAIRVRGVTARANWQNRAGVRGQGAGLYVQQADRVFFERCRSGSDAADRPGTQDWGLLFAQSDVGWQDCDLSGNQRGESRATGASRTLPFEPG